MSRTSEKKGLRGWGPGSLSGHELRGKWWLLYQATHLRSVSHCSPFYQPRTSRHGSAGKGDHLRPGKRSRPGSSLLEKRTSAEHAFAHAVFEAVIKKILDDLYHCHLTQREILPISHYQKIITRLYRTSWRKWLTILLPSTLPPLESSEGWTRGSGPPPSVSESIPNWENLLLTGDAHDPVANCTIYYGKLQHCASAGMPVASEIYSGHRSKARQDPAG